MSEFEKEESNLINGVLENIRYLPMEANGKVQVSYPAKPSTLNCLKTSGHCLKRFAPSTMYLIETGHEAGLGGQAALD